MFYIVWFVAFSNFIIQSQCVAELTNNDFWTFVQDKLFVMVDFYAPWCSDCKELEPVYESVAASLGQNSCLMTKADCYGSAADICRTLGIHSYPQVKVFRNGVYQQDYLGQRTTNELSQFVQSQIPPPQPIDSTSPETASNSSCKHSKVPNKSKKPKDVWKPIH